MNPEITVDFDDLFLAYEWVSASPSHTNRAFVSRATGKVFMVSSELDFDVDEEIPENLDDDSLYAPVPGKRDLDLGNPLALRFAREHLHDDYELVSGYFRQRGAWKQFKHLLDRRDRLDDWHDYESKALKAALGEWSHGEGLRLSE